MSRFGEIIKGREGSGLSQDAARKPSEFIKAETRVAENPLRHFSALYPSGTNKPHGEAKYQNVGMGLLRRVT
jgi:hypothetical protein